jgi:hypothetical protein
VSGHAGETGIGARIPGYVPERAELLEAFLLLLPFIETGALALARRAMLLLLARLALRERRSSRKEWDEAENRYETTHAGRAHHPEGDRVGLPRSRVAEEKGTTLVCIAGSCLSIHGSS